jgi:DNA-binding NarL/FixJ family response regulator
LCLWRGCCPKIGTRYWEDFAFFRELRQANNVLAGVKKLPKIRRDPSPVASKWALTRREEEVLDLLRTGASDKEIASSLGVSRSTASKHVENILAKMKVSNRTAAVGLSLRG